MASIAVLITCYNRKNQTIKCLSSLFKFQLDFDVYLVDDASQDGTSDTISNMFPKVHLIKGNGNLFWNRGMHLAWETASIKDYDYFLWLNDDVILYENCFIELFDSLKLVGENSIISGIIETHDKINIIYGGYDKNRNLIYPNGEIREINFMNGNVVLIPKKVFKLLGNLDPVFHHDLGDVEYGLRAKKFGVGVYTTRLPIGSGAINFVNRERQINVSLKQRFKKLYSPLGSNPNINFYFRKKYFGSFNAVLYFLFQHFINFLPDNLVKKMFGNKYM